MEGNRLGAENSERRENFSAPEVKTASTENPLITAYRMVHGKDPEPEKNLMEIAFGIIEVLDNPNYIPSDLAIECGNEILELRNLKDPVYDARAMVLIRNFEEGVAQNLLPEYLKDIDEVHMDNWDIAYEKYKSAQNTGNQKS